jgi:hypothetical protein
MFCHSPTGHRSRPRRGRHSLPAHLGSLAGLIHAIREHRADTSPILCVAKYLELPAPQSPGLAQSVWGVLVTARIPCTTRRSEATLSAWIVAEELPRQVATRARREAARARLAELERRVRAYLQASGFTCQAGQYLVPVSSFRCRAHFCPPYGEDSRQPMPPAPECD